MEEGDDQAPMKCQIRQVLNFCDFIWTDHRAIHFTDKEVEVQRD